MKLETMKMQLKLIKIAKTKKKKFYLKKNSVISFFHFCLFFHLIP